MIISPADHIAGARRGDGEILSLAAKKGFSVTFRDQILTGLAGRIGILRPQRTVLPIRHIRLHVLVAFIAGHDERRADGRRLAQPFQQIDGSHHIGAKDVFRQIVALRQCGVRRQVEDEIRLRLFERFFDPRPIGDLPLIGTLDTRRGAIKERRIRRESIAVHLSAETLQEKGEPCPLKPRMPGQKDLFPPIKFR